MNTKLTVYIHEPCRQFIRTPKQVYGVGLPAVDAKYEIALKEARECEYWIEIMVDTNIVPKEKFTIMLSEIDQIIRIIVASINTKKRNTSDS